MKVAALGAVLALCMLTSPRTLWAQSPTFRDHSGPGHEGLVLSAGLQWRPPLMVPRPAVALRWQRDLSRSASAALRGPLMLGVAVQAPIEVTDGRSADRVLASDGILALAAGYGIEWALGDLIVQGGALLQVAYHNAGQPLRDERERIVAEQAERFWRGWIGARLGMWWRGLGLHYQLGASRSLGIEREAAAFDFPLSAEIDALGHAQRLAMTWALSLNDEPRPELYIDLSWASPRRSLEALQLSVVIATTWWTH